MSTKCADNSPFGQSHHCFGIATIRRPFVSWRGMHAQCVERAKEARQHGKTCRGEACQAHLMRLVPESSPG